MKLQVDENITLNRIYKKDKRDLVSRISHPEIAKNTLTIPYPYKSEDADFFFNLIEQAEKEKGKQLNWAIRHKEDGMIGSIGLLGGVALGNLSRDAFCKSKIIESTTLSNVTLQSREAIRPPKLSLDYWFST